MCAFFRKIFAFKVSHAQTKPNVDPFIPFIRQMPQCYDSIIASVTEFQTPSMAQAEKFGGDEINLDLFISPRWQVFESTAAVKNGCRPSIRFGQ